MLNLLTRRRLLSTAGTVLATSYSIPGQSVDADAKALHCVWELVSLEDHQPDGGVAYWLGKRPSGTLVYTPGGRMSVQLLADPHPTFSSSNVFGANGRTLSPSVADAEVRQAYSGYYAYFGTYEVNERDHVITHRLTSSLRPKEIGSSYERPYTLLGDQLVFRYAVPGDRGGTEARVITWRRSEWLRS